MMSPCMEYCYLRFGKEYSSECDTKCEFASVVKENKELKERLKKYESDTSNSIQEET